MAIPSHEPEHLASFHHTISQQLNARLEESPRFFWALVVVSTGYGYVLWNVANATKQNEPELLPVLILASLLSYVAVLWASWYLAALGYAFRYLQSGQHCIEYALGWDAYVPQYGEPPAKIRWWRCGDVFWLLPGIYHAHVGGLVAFLAIIILAFCCYGRQWGGSYSELSIVFIGLFFFLFGVAFIFWINKRYVQKFRKKWKNPREVAVLGDCEAGIQTEP